MKKGILLLATLDTKRLEAVYLRDRIRELGHETLIMDLSMGGGSGVEADVEAEEVAKEGGASLEEIRASRERAKITEIMTRGAIRCAQRLYDERRIEGIIGLGGATVSHMATEVMRALPFGIPKLMVSSSAALPGLSTRYIGKGDISLMHTVVEISGLNELLMNVLERAARAICGMVQTPSPVSSLEKGSLRIALSMFGPCDRCAHMVQKALEERGMQVIGFHAAGICDRAMEEMIAQGLFDGVVDLAPGGVGEELFGGMRSAGPDRLESAGRVGIPQVVAPSGVNFMSPPRSKYKPEYHSRRKFDLDRHRTWLRLSPQELVMVARAFAEKLNRAQGPVIFLAPLKGWSSVDVPGSPVYDPDEDRVFIEDLKRRLRPDIEIREVDANLEDPAFADAVIEAVLELFKRG